MKVSICVVSYNQAGYIGDCLQSLVDQDCGFDYEVLVSDDGSTDSTREIIASYAKAYPEKIKPIFRESNIGPFRNYIDTHNQAAGQYVAHCDGDDLFLPTKLRLQAKYLDDHPDCSVVYGMTEVFNDAGDAWPYAPRAREAFNDGVFRLQDVTRMGSVGIHSAQMYRASARRTRDTSVLAMDIRYTMEFLESGFGAILPDILTRYRYNTNAGTMTTSSAGQLRNKRLIAGYMREIVARHPGLRRDVFIGALTNFIIDIKNRRRSALYFAHLAVATASLVSPGSLISNLRRINMFKTRSPQKSSD